MGDEPGIETESRPKCAKCDKEAHELNKFCREHMDEAAVSSWRSRRIRLPEVLALVVAGGLLWAYPKYDFKGWAVDYLEEAAESDEPSMLQPFNRFLANLVGERSDADREDARRVAALLRKALMGGGGSTAGASSAEDLLDRLQSSAASSGRPAPPLGELQDKLEAAEQRGTLNAVEAEAIVNSLAGQDLQAPGVANTVGEQKAGGDRVARGSTACGNGVAEVGEQCDGEALAGASCESLGFTGDCGDAPACVRRALGCLASCVFDYSGCAAERRAEPVRFVDKHDGTLADRLTRLVWEVKCSGPTCPKDHEVDETLAWREAVGDWVNRLNGEAYAGYHDWRLPTVTELGSLFQNENACETPPCAPALLSGADRTASAAYWSAISFSIDTTRAWVVSFADGKSFTVEKTDARHVRAVRGDS